MKNGGLRNKISNLYINIKSWEANFQKNFLFHISKHVFSFKILLKNFQIFRSFLFKKWRIKNKKTCSLIWKRNVFRERFLLHFPCLCINCINSCFSYQLSISSLFLLENFVFMIIIFLIKYKFSIIQIIQFLIF